MLVISGFISIIKNNDQSLLQHSRAFAIISHSTQILKIETDFNSIQSFKNMPHCTFRRVLRCQKTNNDISAIM